MTVYDYIAQRNPNGARNVLSQFGYSLKYPKQAQNAKYMGNNLLQLVQREGEPALRAIMDIHPDKGVIMETFQAEESKDCGCHKNNGNSNQYMNFDGMKDSILASAVIQSQNNSNNSANNNESNKLSAQSSAMIIAGSIFIATSIVIGVMAAIKK